MDDHLPKLREPHDIARTLAENLHKLSGDLRGDGRPNVEAVIGQVNGIAISIDVLADRLTEEGSKQAVISEAIDTLLGMGSPTDRVNAALRILRRGAEGERVR